MARKRPIEDPPSASSCEKEESSEGNNSSADDEEVKTPLKKEKADSDYDSDMSLPSPNISDFTIKPIVPKPNKSAPKPKHSAKDPISKRKKSTSTASKGVKDKDLVERKVEVIGREKMEEREWKQVKIKEYEEYLKSVELDLVIAKAALKFMKGE